MSAQLAQLTQTTHWTPQRALLALLTAAACIGVFLLARALALAPTLPLTWRLDPAAMQVVSVRADAAALQGRRVHTLQCPQVPQGVALGLRLRTPQRWQIDPALQQAQVDIARCLAGESITLTSAGAAPVTLAPTPRGWAQLGLGFWLAATLALTLILTAVLVSMLGRNTRRALYSVMALAQGAQMLLLAVDVVPALAPPAALVGNGPALAAWLDLVTVAAMVQSALTSLPAQGPVRGVTAAVWAVVALAAPALFASRVPVQWAHGLLWLSGLACLLLLSWVQRHKPHPFVLTMRRHGMALWLTLTALLVSLAVHAWHAPAAQPALDVAAVVWSVFVAMIVLLMPYAARTQLLLHEVALVAGAAMLATALDTLAATVLALDPGTALTLALLVALGLYATLRHALMSARSSSRAAATERMVASLYRVVREVEARPERAGERMTALLEHVFEPVTVATEAQSGKRTVVAGNGTRLLVPLPALVADGPARMASLALADRGQRLFDSDDALLADRILEQLMRAVAQDRAVERGRSEERARIAQDLHDDIGARLLTLMYKAPNRDVEAYVRHTLQDLKTLTRGLAAKAQTLELALAEWRTDIEHRLSTVGVTLQWEARIDMDCTLSTTEWSSLTRILRELVSNTIAHAQAQTVEIACVLRNGRLSITVRDDGIGRNPQAWSRGLGLGGVRKRLRQLGGEVQWSEREPRGIVCEVVAPLGR